MSGTIGSSAYGSLARILSSMSDLQSQYTTLQQQTSSGKVAQTYAGLAPQAAQTLTLSGAISRSTAYTQVITQSQGKASAMQDALTQIVNVVNGMATSSLQLVSSSDPSTTTTTAQQAQLALQQVVSLLNTTYGGGYVFAGADTANAPVPNPSGVTTSGMYTQIGTQVQALATVPTTPAIGQVIANTVASAADPSAGTTIFSHYLTTPPPGGMGAAPSKIQISDSQYISLDLPANQNVGAVSDPSINGTGSAINDILRGLAVLANSTPAMASNPDFGTLMQNVSTTLTSAAQTLTNESASLGITQNSLTAAASAQDSMQVALKSQLSNATDVDMATAISKLQAVSTQLQASYQIIAMTKDLNLASYL